MSDPQFSEMVKTALGVYVYALLDPRMKMAIRERVFYVGKGTGNRAFNHARLEKEAKDGPLDPSEHKLRLIREIRGDGFEVEILIVKHGLDDDQALQLESALIPILGSANKVAGHKGGLTWLEENRVRELYDSPLERGEIPQLRRNILVVSLNQQPTDVIEDPAKAQILKLQTVGDWNVSQKNSERVDFIIGVKNGLVTSIYEVDKCDDGSAKFERIEAQKKRAHGRSRFSASDVPLLLDVCRGRTLMDGPSAISKIRPGAGCQFFPAMD